MRMPHLLYGTAWKDEATAQLTRAAIDVGYRGIDTANQRKHYHEAGVGEALRGAFKAGLSRDEIFVQTKFTYRDGQDHRLPYEALAPRVTQVDQSAASSLEHLGVDYIDSYVLHGPATRRGLVTDDWEAWKAMEALHAAGKAKMLGVSNVDLDQLEQLFEEANVKPGVVQNRCFAATGWDRRIRAFCRKNGLAYQGFSLLTANVEVLQDARLRAVARRVGKTVPQVVFRFCHQVGMTILTGTTSPQHMAQDLAIFDFELTPEEIEMIEKAGE